MKKIIITLAIAISTLTSFAGEEINVSTQVLNAFNSEFVGAKEVTWTAGSTYYKAAFVFNGQHIYAFYSTKGDLMGLTRYLSSVDLPMNLQSGLKKSYSQYWISDLFEVSNSEGTTYYITLENADTRVILKSTDASDWSVFNKLAKA
jgi:hypothetical protein